MKTCARCKAQKPATTEFFNKKLAGLSSRCRECRSVTRRFEHAALSPAELRALNERRRAARIADVYRIRRRDRERYARNPEKKKASAAAFRAANPGKAKHIQARYYERNRALRIQQAIEWGKANPEKRRVYWKRVYSKRRSNPSFRLGRSVSAHIWYSLKGSKNGQKWENLVGFTAGDLVSHLERQFTPGMSWDNYGAWHIDHILPASSFYYVSAEDEEFKACWALTNLRPLWAEQNIQKRDQRLHLI